MAAPALEDFQEVHAGSSLAVPAVEHTAARNPSRTDWDDQARHVMKVALAAAHQNSRPSGGPVGSGNRVYSHCVMAASHTTVAPEQIDAELAMAVRCFEAAAPARCGIGLVGSS